MATEAPPSYPSLRLTKTSAKFACGWFIIACGLSPGYGSSIGMTWPLFWATWGVVLVLSIVSFLGYIVCKRRKERISIFYAICPVLLIIALLVFLNLYDIVHVILHFEGAFN
jgi:hypothetical protein